MTTMLGNSSPDLVEIMHDIRVQLSLKGNHSFRQLTQAFAVNDKLGTQQFSCDAFIAVLGKIGVFLSSQNGHKLFRYFEQASTRSGHPGTLNFIEFLQTLQGMMSQKRFDMICLVFDTIDQASNGSRTGAVDFQSILSRFDPRAHPEALSGKKTPEQVRSEFIAAFDGSNQSINHSVSGTQGRITRDAFIDFYAGISACTPLDDDFFCTTLERCFSVKFPVNQSQQRKALLNTVRALLRQRIATRDSSSGPRTESEKLRILLKWYDLKESGMINFQQFHGGLQRFGLVLDDITVHALFEAFDYENKGLINYAEFVAVLYEDDIVSTYWSERQIKHKQSINAMNSAQEEKQQERQYLTSDSIILSTPKVPSAATINSAVRQDNRSAPRATAVFVLGGPGSGKGTQCARIVEEFGFTHLSTGDLLRAEQANPNSQYGALINQCITDGKLVPVDLIVKLLEQAIMNGVKQGSLNYLVDGFPRAVDQLAGWDAIMGPHSIRVPFVLYFDVPLEVLEKRLIQRGLTSGRADDNIESIKKRFLTFETESRPVVGHFSKEGRVRVLDGTKTPDQVYQEVRACIQSLSK